MSEQVNMATHYEHEIPEGYEARIEGNKVIIELKESEDERIRKEIIDYFYKCSRRNSKSGFRLEQYKSWIAYLKKQKDILGERAKSITASMLEDRIEGIQCELIEFLSNTVNASWLDIRRSADAYAERIRNIIEKQKEQKPSTEETELNSIAFLEQMGYTCIPPKEQQPAEWSEDELDAIEQAIMALEQRYDPANNGFVGHKLTFHEAALALKSLRPRLSDEEIKKIRSEEYTKGFNDAAFGSKQGWSEEDSKTIHLACEFIRHHAIKGGSIGGIDYSELVERLKSLRPQHHWKPSELQMFALDSAILMFHNLKRGGDKEELESLYNDLKKL